MFIFLPEKSWTFSLDGWLYNCCRLWVSTYWISFTLAKCLFECCKQHTFIVGFLVECCLMSLMHCGNLVYTCRMLFFTMNLAIQWLHFLSHFCQWPRNIRGLATSAEHLVIMIMSHTGNDLLYSLLILSIFRMKLRMGTSVMEATC